MLTHDLRHLPPCLIFDVRQKKTMNLASVFVVQHVRSESDSEDTKMIGVYSSREEAEAAVERKRKFSGFSDFPRIVDPMVDKEESGFYISEMILNHDYWSEGFVYESESTENKK